MTKIAAHEGESVWVGSSTRQAGDIADSMARAVEEIEGAVSKEVTRRKGADFQRLLRHREVYFDHISPSVGQLSDCKQLEWATPGRMGGGTRLTRNTVRTQAILAEWDSQGESHF